ncbi:hypothetical protein, partial [Actinomyces bouchesdurhonensis]|uniref:hypothetical protein n=1 Tax=Actinomyces bouchesdurhonensis TaxID=1852361 RepID=UPI0028E58093
MTLTHRLTIATALSATLATALIAGPAMASPSDENQPTGPGTANGDKSTACRADWTAAAILDTDILAHHPELVNPADITRNADGTVNKIATGSNNGYTSKISTNFNTEIYKAPGMFEANHWIAGSMQNWRFPVATKNKLAAGTTITVDLPDDMADTKFIGKLETRAGLNAYMQAWGPREAEYTWNDGDFTATQTDAAKNIWTITLNKGLDANTGTIFQFTGTFPTGAESSTASANLVGAQFPADGQVCGDLPTPETPELTKCQVTTVDRTVWSPYSRDINERSKYAGSWGSEEPKWGEANADGWFVATGTDPKVDDSRTLRLYGATHKDLTNATLTIKAVQGLTFDASTINTISNPGAGALKGNGFTNTVEGLGDIKVSEDGKTITVTIKHMPANSGFSFNINGILTGETLENSPILAPIVLHNWLTGTDSECTVPTEEPTTPAPSDSPTPEPTTPAPAPSATPSGNLARTGADTP